MRRPSPAGLPRPARSTTSCPMSTRGVVKIPQPDCVVRHCLVRRCRHQLEDPERPTHARDAHGLSVSGDHLGRDDAVVVVLDRLRARMSCESSRDARQRASSRCAGESRGERGSARSPDTPPSSMPRRPPTSEATTGVPQLIASWTTPGRLSNWLVSTINLPPPGSRPGGARLTPHPPLCRAARTSQQFFSSSTHHERERRAASSEMSRAGPVLPPEKRNTAFIEEDAVGLPNEDEHQLVQRDA